MSHVNKLFLSLFTFVVIAAAASAARADVIQLTSASQLSAGAVTAVYPEPPGTFLPSPYTLTTPGNTLTFTLTNGGEFLLVQGPGAKFLYNGAVIPDPTNPDYSPIAINFASGVTEFGLQAAHNLISEQQTFTFTLFGGAAQLGTFNVIGPGGTFLFLGARATGGDVITRVLISAEASQPPGRPPVGSDFAIGPVALSNVAQPIPEPTTMLLLGTGLAGIAARVRRRRKE